MVDANQSSDESELDKDDEVAELKEALTEIISDFKGESEERSIRLDKEIQEHSEFNTLITKIKMQGINS